MMKRCVLVKPGEIGIVDMKIPEPGPGELLIEVRAALTCGTDLKAFLRGHPMIPMPGPFGHEFSGVVAAVGKGVRKFKVGDEVMSVHSAPCLSCPYCERGLHNLCERIMESKVMGAFGEYVLLPEHIVKQNVYKKPKHVSFEEAALMEPLACVVHGVEPLDVREGETALVLGAGPIGLLHVMLLKHKGAVAVAADPNKTRLIAAKEFGADMTVLPEHIPLAVKKATGGFGFDCVIECTGLPPVWESTVSHVRRGGTVVLFGGCPSGTRVSFDTHRIHYDEITLKGDFHFTPADVKEAHRLICESGMDFSGMISGTYPLRGLGKALENLGKGKGIKYAIVPHAH